MALMAALTSPLSAAIVVQTGFETTDSPAYALGNLPTTTSLPVYDVNGLGTRSIQSSGSPFGAGNAYLAVGGANLRVRASGITALTTISFDFYEPSGTSNVMSFGFGGADVNNNSTTGAYHVWNLDNGVITAGQFTTLASGSSPTVAEDQHYQVQILLNRSGTSQTVPLPTSGDVVIGNQQSALFLVNMTTGALIAGGVYGHSSTVTPSNFFFRAFGAGGNLIYIDDFTRRNDLTLVPEPGVAMAGGISLLGLLARRRRR